jgi:RNA polymerase sigma-70 factor (ECF subfamily)
MTGARADRRFEDAMLPHLGAAYEVARWLTGSSHDAEDIVQEAYLRAFRFFDGWQGDNARAWLLAIVRNTAMSWLKHNRPKHVASMAPDALAVASEWAMQRGDLAAATPEMEAIELAERSDLLCVLEAMPALFKEVIVLRELQDFSYREIAAITGVPEGTVMSRLARARAELRRLWLKRDR